MSFSSISPHDLRILSLLVAATHRIQTTSQLPGRRVTTPYKGKAKLPVSILTVTALMRWLSFTGTWDCSDEGVS
ncbi:hypothetical protein M501DRAFT_996870, partial [Patellaria atrata CBS 101060]